MALSETLKKRLSTAAIGIPLVFAALYCGGFPLLWVFFALFLISVWEWQGMVVKMPTTPERVVFTVAGIAYFAAAFIAMAKLSISFGLPYMLLLLLIVWTSDTTAYLVGKNVGGPKLAPTISPNKTISGLCGAMAGPAILAPIFTYFMPLENDALTSQHYIAIGLLLGFAGQCGDLLISAVKRKVGVKDTSNILPGHGGILDRIDALLLVGLVYLAILVLSGHPAGVFDR